MQDYCTVVTGAASGIGYAVASKLLAAGESIVAADLNEERLAEKFGGNANAVVIACDLTTEDGVKCLFEGIKSRFSGVRGFVHAAGFDEMAPLGMIAPDAMQRLFAIHAIFPVQFLGWMAKKQNRAPDAAAVLISSLAAHEGAKGHVAYAAAKGAVEGFLKSAAAELVEKGVRLNAVVLGVVETEMSQGWIGKLSKDQRMALEKGYPLGLGRPSDVAEVVKFLLSPAARWVTGQAIVCDGGHELT